MAPLSTLITHDPIKLLLIGDSSSGKTGSLCSLAAAGYNLRIIDIDKGSEIIANYLSDKNSLYYKKDPEAISRVEVVRISDAMRSINGVLSAVKGDAWQRAMKLLMDWTDGDTKLGPISSWGPKDVLVIDSLSGLTKMALNFHLMMNGALAKTRTQNEARRDIGAAQEYIRGLLELLYDDNIKCNVIVIAHITGVTEAGGAPKVEDGSFNSIPTGFPSAIGRALSPQIPRWFNNMLVVSRTIQGTRSTHRIYTSSQYLNGMNIGAKTSAPLRVKPEYPLETGLADFFADLRST